jgi:hypothetical protein
LIITTHVVGCVSFIERRVFFCVFAKSAIETHHHLVFNLLMGDEVANTMMEHLPPSGWSEVARQSDIALVRGEIELVKMDIAHVGKELSGLKTILLVVGPLIAGGIGGLYGLIATKF